MKVPEDFILAALFSEIGRLRKRAEGTPGSVRDVSQRWLEQKQLSHAAKALATWGSFVTKAAHLALGSEPATAGQRRLDEDVGDLSSPLVSLFSKVPPLPEEARFLPYPLNQEYAYPLDDLRVSRDAYQDLWNRLNTEVDANLKVEPSLTPDTALVLLENYTACVPYLLPVGDDPRNDPFSDISLFDHLKMTAAIASCLYTYAMEQTDGREEEAAKFERSGDQAYLLVGGDFSGVQEFIYRISSKGALKAVRGRSFFLELLTQHVVAELLEATGCSRANVLYAAGAQFSLLLPNTRDACAKVTRIKRESNSYLIQVHAGKFSLILEYLECSDANLLGKKKDGWSHVRAELGREIGKSKSRKFVEFFQHKEARDLQKEEVNCHCCGAVSEIVGMEELKRWRLDGPLCRFCFLLIPKSSREEPEAKAEEVNFPQDLRQCQWCKATGKQPVLCWVGEEIIAGCRHDFCLGKMEKGECTVCHRQTLLSPLPTAEVQTAIENKAPDDPELLWACPFCRNLYHLGEHLPSLRYVRRSHQKPTDQPRMVFNVGPWFYYFPEREADFTQNLRHEPTARGWIINEKRAHCYVTSGLVSPLPLGNYHPSVKALDFSGLAEKSIGSQLIGVLRMDVDNLGELFTRKIPKEAATPVRTSALSRLLTRFFTDFINALCRGEGLPGGARPFQLLYEQQPDEPSKKRWVTVVYSGGDDLFIVGAWSEVIELAFDIHTAFRRYVCDHPEITLSGGMIVQHEDFPLYQMANLAKDAEDEAKKNEHALKMLKEPQSRTKDSFAPFYLSGQKAFFWDEAEKLQELAKDLVRHLKDDQTPADNRLHLKVPRALLTQLFEIVEIYKQEGKLYLPRLHYTLAHDDIAPELKQKLLSLDTIRYLHPALVWLDLLSRGEASHARD